MGCRPVERAHHVEGDVPARQPGHLGHPRLVEQAQGEGEIGPRVGAHGVAPEDPRKLQVRGVAHGEIPQHVRGQAEQAVGEIGRGGHGSWAGPTEGGAVRYCSP